MSASRIPPAAPPLAGRYLLLDQLGAGAMGTVWRVWDLRRQRFCAAKVLAHTHSSLLLRFVREQGLRIDHPHVVAPTGWAAEDDLVIFTMDLVRGGSVADLPGPLTERYVAVLLDQLLSALTAVHRHDVVHRDVKPANLLLEATGTGRPHLRLGDFGVAAVLTDPRLTLVPGAVGSPGFMAPEQEAGAAPDPRQDLYAAGRVALLLRGPGAEAGTPFDTFVRRLAAADPGARPDSAATARHELRTLAVPPPKNWLPLPDRLPEVSIPVAEALHLDEPAAPRRTGSGSAVAGAIACFVAALLLCALALARIVAQQDPAEQGQPAGEAEQQRSHAGQPNTVRSGAVGALS